MAFNYSMLFGKMKNEKISQKNMADILGVTASTFSLKINGKASFTQSEIFKICETLGIPKEEVTDYFFTP